MVSKYCCQHKPIFGFPKNKKTSPTAVRCLSQQHVLYKMNVPGSNALNRRYQFSKTRNQSTSDINEIPKKSQVFSEEIIYF